jgi:PKD domain-containing protein
MRGTPLRRLRRSLLLLFSLVACGDGSLEPLPLQISIQPSRTTAAPGDPIGFRVTAQGGDLLGVDIDYGDNTADQRGAGGARTARMDFSHAFSAAGVYQVRATVTDAVAGTMDAGVEIRVQ